MSYGFLGTFVDVKNKRILFTAELDRLKSLNERAYSCELKNIYPTGTAKDEDYPDVTTDVMYEYVGYYKQNVIPELAHLGFDTYRKKEWNRTNKAYYLPEDVIGSNADILSAYEVKPAMEELTTFNEDSDDIIILYAKRIKNNNGSWYRYEDFSQAEEKIKSEYFKKLEELYDLKKIRNTKEYFEMSENGKESYLSEVSYFEDLVEECKWEYDAIEYILHIFDFIKEDIGFQKVNEFGEKSFDWYYDDNRDVELYIEVD